MYFDRNATQSASARFSRDGSPVERRAGLPQAAGARKTGPRPFRYTAGPEGLEPMPIYEYRCDECEQVFEAIQRISDEPLDACRHCGAAARRIVSSPAIQFLGSGWYVTDYARKSGEKGANGNGASGKAGSSGKPGSGSKADKGDGAKSTGRASGAKTSSSGSGSESRASSPSAR